MLWLFWGLIMDNTSLDEFKETLSLFNNKITRNTQIVTPESLGQHYLLHIAKEKFKELLPNVSRRAAYSEDNTIPRIHTAPALIECINGYASITHDILNGDFETKSKKGLYKGGYYIYFIPFEYALKPNNKLVYDAEATNEHWLITYNKETKTYKTSNVGRVINVGCSFTPDAINNGTKESIFLAIEIPKDQVLRLDEKQVISSGYWSVDISRPDNRDLFTCQKPASNTKGQFDTLLVEKTKQLSLEAHQKLLYQ